MTFLPLLFIFGGLINSQNILQLGLIELLGKYDMRKKNHAYIKNEGFD